MNSIEDQLILHERLKLKPYRCSAGKLTIGVGRNLEDKGISEEEALFLLRNDIAEAELQLTQYDKMLVTAKTSGDKEQSPNKEWIDLIKWVLGGTIIAIVTWMIKSNM